MSEFGITGMICDSGKCSDLLTNLLTYSVRRSDDNSSVIGLFVTLLHDRDC